MRKIKKAIIHLGTEKTGSSVLQNFFHKNRSLIANQGFYFMRSSGIKNDSKLAGYCLPRHKLSYYLFKNLGIDTYEKKDEFDKKFLHEFRDEFSQLPKNIHTVIFSSEFFHSRLKDSSERLKLKDFIYSYFEEVVLISYIRPQIDVNLSLYSTTLKSSLSTASLHDHLKPCHNKNYYYNYYKYLTGWEETFYESELKVRIFSKDDLLHGDVVEDFCSCFGVDSNTLFNVAKENESLTPTGQKLMVSLNKHFCSLDKDDTNKLIRKVLRDLVIESFSGKGQRPEKNIAIDIQSRFSEINELVRSKYFPNRKKLFFIDFDDYFEVGVDKDVLVFFEKILSGIDKNWRLDLVGEFDKN